VVQEGKHVQNEKAVDSIQIGQEEAMVQRTKNVQNREVLYQNDRMKMIFHGPLIPQGSKKLKRRKGVWQAVRDDSKDSDEGDKRLSREGKGGGSNAMDDNEDSEEVYSARRDSDDSNSDSQGVGNVEGPDNGSPTDFSFMTFHEFLLDGSYFMSSYYL